MVNDGGRIKIVKQTDGVNYILIMEISNITPEDGGTYKVNAKNKLGESNANINLNLEGMDNLNMLWPVYNLKMILVYY